MGFFNFRKTKKEKMVTDNQKVIDAEIGTVTTSFVAPRFNRQIAVNSYNGYWAAAIDYNSNAAASGIIRLYSRTSKNGTKCLFDTTTHNDVYQKEFMNGSLNDKPSHNAQYKSMDTQEDFEIVQGHPITQLFRKANPSQSTYQLFYSIFLSLEITGDAYVHVVSLPNGQPDQLYVLQAQHVDVVPAKTGTGRVVEKYIYKKNISSPVDFPPDEIIHIKYPNPDSIWYGMGKIEKGWHSYLLNKFSHEYQIALYANNAVPDYLLINKSGNSISKKRFFNKMASLTRGASNRGKIMAVDGDVDIKSVAFKPKDLSDVTLNIQEIASVSGCPINKLIGNDNVKANSEEQNTSWLRNTIHPMMKLVASSLSEQLLWRYGIVDGDAFLEYDSPVPQDFEEKRKNDEAYSKIGVLTNNEIRVSMGRDALGEELDKTYFNGQTFGQVEESENSSFLPRKNINSNSSVDDGKIKIKLDDIIASAAKSTTKELNEKIDDMMSEIQNQSPIEIVVGDTIEREFIIEEQPEKE